MTIRDRLLGSTILRAPENDGGSGGGGGEGGNAAGAGGDHWSSSISDEGLKGAASKFETRDKMFDAMGYKPEPARAEPVKLPVDHWAANVSHEGVKSLAANFKTQDEMLGAMGYTPAPADWRAGIADPKLREMADRYESPTAVLKANAELAGRLSSSVRKLGDNPTDEDVAAYRKEVGVPAKAEINTDEGYKIAPNKDYPEAWYTSEPAVARLGRFAQIAHQYNVPGAALQAMTDAYMAELKADADATIKADKENAETTERALKSEWGTDYEQNKNFAHNALHQAGADGLLTLKTSDDRMVADHPLILKAFAALGRAMAEDGTIGGVRPDADTLREQADQARQKREEARQKGDLAAVRKYDEMEREILGKMSGRGPIVGSEARAV